MSSVSDLSTNSSVGNDSLDFEQEIEGLAEAAAQVATPDSGIDRPYADEPLADEDWMRNYRRRRNEERQRREMLASRLNETIPLNTCCRCDNCQLQNLSNERECCCCSELEAVALCLSDERVSADMGSTPRCITQHPAFTLVCLEKWSLWQAADRYKTKNKSRYKKAGGENKYLRAISYREFTRLVHGRLGNKRIPLPACAYNRIRQTFPATEITGYESDSE